MNSVLRISGLIFASVALLVGGCAKKPRPNPYQTISGSGSESAINPRDVGLAEDPTSMLDQRDQSQSADNVIRGELPTIYFDFDSAAVRVAERAKIAQAAERMKSDVRIRVLLEGHCDWRGTAEYNLGLGDRRAKAVKDYLATLGITADRLEILSKGDEGATEGGTEAQMQNDRRVEICIFK